VTSFEIVGLVVSPVRRYESRPADGPRGQDGLEQPQIATVRAHRGIAGDRYFGARHAFAAVTMISVEALERLERLEHHLGTGPFDPRLARRNVITRGLDVDALARTDFAIDLGAGPIAFRSLTRAHPCAWMDVVYAPGAHPALRGHGGIRCEPLSDGELRLGPATLVLVAPIPPTELRSRISGAMVA